MQLVHGKDNLIIDDLANYKSDFDATLAHFKGHKDYVTSVCFSGNSKYIASGSHDRSVIVWNVETGNIEHRLQGHRDDVQSVSFSGNSKYIASGSSDKNIMIWNVDTGQLEHILRGHSHHIHSVCFSKDSKIFQNNDIVYIPSICIYNDGELIKMIEAGINLKLPEDTIDIINKEIDNILNNQF